MRYTLLLMLAAALLFAHCGKPHQSKQAKSTTTAMLQNKDVA